MKDLISVVIPVRDRVEELNNTLRSVCNQTYKQLEIIVVENNSSKPNLIVDLIKDINDVRIKLFHLVDCKNANVARNYGADIASGVFIAFLDSDDIWLEEHLSESYKHLLNVGADFVYSGAIVDNGESLLVKKARDLFANENGADYLLGFNGGYAQTSSYLITKSAFNKIKWDETLTRNQDLDYFIRLSLNFNISYTGNNDLVIIYWPKNVKRIYNFQSMKRFYNTYYHIMKFSTAVRYSLIGIRFSVQNGMFFDSLIFLTFIIKRIFCKSHRVL